MFHLVSDEDQTTLVSRLTTNENELFICEDNDVSKIETNQHGQSSKVVEEEKKTQFTNDEHDEAFERDFQRALDRAIAVVNKDENTLLQTNEDRLTTEQSPLNLVQITEQALSSLNNSPLFQVDKQDICFEKNSYFSVYRMMFLLSHHLSNQKNQLLIPMKF